MKNEEIIKEKEIVQAEGGEKEDKERNECDLRA